MTHPRGPGAPRTRRAAAALAAVLLLATGCADEAAPGNAVPPQGNVDVDTPALREQKAAAGIEDCQPGTGPAPPVEGLPNMTLACLGGGPDVTLDQLRGPMVINLFAQWCEPCRTELPIYQRLHQDAKGKLKVLGIDYLDTQPDGALELAKATGVTFPLLADPDGTLRPEFRIRGLPGVLFVDEDGRVTAVEFTVVRSYSQLAGLVKQHLGLSV